MDNLSPLKDSIKKETEEVVLAHMEERYLKSTGIVLGSKSESYPVVHT